MKEYKEESHGFNNHNHHDRGNSHDTHNKHAGHSPGMFRDKFWISLILTLPVVFWSAHPHLGNYIVKLECLL